MTLLVTYYSDDRRTIPSDFEILMDGQPFARQQIERIEPPRLFDVAYPLPARQVEGKNNVTVRFEAVDDSQVAAVFGIRMIRADAEY